MSNAIIEPRAPAQKGQRAKTPRRPRYQAKRQQLRPIHDRKVYKLLPGWKPRRWTRKIRSILGQRKKSTRRRARETAAHREFLQQREDVLWFARRHPAKPPRRRRRT